MLPRGALSKQVRTATCKACLRQCTVCTRRLADDEAVGMEPEHRVCEKCAFRRDTAKTNLYFRYPQVKYKWAPHDPAALRKRIADDDLSQF